MGLYNKSGNKISKNGINTVLKNSFYTGLIKVEKTGEIYAGIHHPLVSQHLFDKVQAVLSGKQVDKKQTHYFVFRRILTCESCGYRLIAETHKGYVYYRCQTDSCSQKTIREELIEKEMLSCFELFEFSEQENLYLKNAIKSKYGELEVLKQNRRKTLHLQLEQCRERLSKLTDYFVDGVIEQELYIQKKNSLIVEEKKLQEESANFDEIQKTRSSAPRNSSNS